MIVYASPCHTKCKKTFRTYGFSAMWLATTHNNIFFPFITSTCTYRSIFRYNPSILPLSLIVEGFTEMVTIFRSFRKYLNNSTVVQRIRVYNRIAFSPKYLLFTNVCISISLSSVGDCLEQQYEIFTNDLDEYSAKRTAHMALSGWVHCQSTAKLWEFWLSNGKNSCRSTVGVVCHYWYKFLDKRMPGRNLTIVLKKVFWDQMICSPIVISTFFLTLGVLEQSSREEIVAEIKSKAWKLYAGKISLISDDRTNEI